MRRATTCLLVVAAFHIAAVAQAPVARGLSAAWSLDGRWSGVVGDEESGAIYTLRREFALSSVDGMTLRLGKFPRPTLLTFFVWGARGRARHSMHFTSS